MRWIALPDRRSAAIALIWLRLRSNNTSREAGRSLRRRTGRLYSTLPPAWCSTSTSASMTRWDPPRATGQPAIWAVALSTRAKLLVMAAVKGSVA